MQGCNITLKQKQEKPIASHSHVQAFPALTFGAHKVTPRSIYFAVFIDRLKKQYIPSLPQGLALKYLKDLKMHPKSTKSCNIDPDVLETEEKVT